MNARCTLSVSQVLQKQQGYFEGAVTIFSCKSATFFLTCLNKEVSLFRCIIIKCSLQESKKKFTIGLPRVWLSHIYYISYSCCRMQQVLLNSCSFQPFWIYRKRKRLCLNSLFVDNCNWTIIKKLFWVFQIFSSMKKTTLDLK